MAAVVTVWEREERVLRVDMTRCPDRDAIDHLFGRLRDIATSRARPFVLHLRHVDDEQFDPPTLPDLLHIVSRIVSDLSDTTTLSRVVVQPKFVDPKVMDAHKVLLNYVPGVKIRVHADPAKAQTCIARGLSS